MIQAMAYTFIIGKVIEVRMVRFVQSQASKEVTKAAQQSIVFAPPSFLASPIDLHRHTMAGKRECRGSFQAQI